jgi:predicted RND superfamily exporter protein
MILEAIGRAVTKAPAAFVIGIVLISAFFGAFMSQVSFEAEDEDFNPDTDVALASERVNEYFGVGVTSVQVIAQDGRGDTRDVLTRDALMGILDLEEAILEPKEGDLNVSDVIQGTETVPTGVQSVADLVAFGAMTLQGAEAFDQGMVGLSQALEQMDMGLAGLAHNLSSMNLSDGESVGTTLFTTNATLAALVQGLLDLAQSGLLPSNGGGNGGASLVPDLTTVKGIVAAMDDTQVKATVVGMFSFDEGPLNLAVGDVLAAKQSLQLSSNVSAGSPVGGPLVSYLMDPSFLAGNFTFSGMPVNASVLIENSLASLYTIQAALGELTGFEAQPFVLENILSGLSAGMKVFLSLDFDPASSTPTAKASLMIVQQNGSLDSKRILQAQYDIEEIAKKVEKDSGGQVEFGIMGGEILFDKINTSSMESLGFLLFLAILFIIVILAMVFRSLADTAFTLVALMLVITWTFGLGALLGFTFNPLTTAVPILLVGLSVDYGIHLIMRYRLEKRKKSLSDSAIATIVSVGMALLLATVTTVFSFMSNILSSLEVMRQFGTLTALGIISAFIIMNTFVPACRLLMDQRRERRGLRRKSEAKADGARRENALVRFVQLGAHGASKYGTFIIVGSLVLSGLSFYTLTGIESEFDFMDFLPDDLPETQTINYLTDNFNFSFSSSTVLIEGDVATKDVMAAMARAQADMDDDADVVKVHDRADVSSPLTVVHKYCLPTSPSYVTELGQAFQASDTNGDQVPDQDVPGLLGTLTDHPISGKEMASVLHRDEAGDFDAAIIRVGVYDAPDGGEGLTEELLDDAAPLEGLEEDGDLDGVIVTNGPVLTYNVVSEMNEGGLKSVLATIIAAAILLTIVFFAVYRTLVVGILTTIPIILVIGWVFGSMFLLDIPINVITITVSALTVGLGITYAIHISHRFLEDVEKEPWEEALCTTVGHTGAALFGAAATTVGGFGILTFSILQPMAQFGIVTALSILFSFLASVFVLPSFLAVWARWKFGPSQGKTCAPDGPPEEGILDIDAEDHPEAGDKDAE